MTHKDLKESRILGNTLQQTLEGERIPDIRLPPGWDPDGSTGVVASANKDKISMTTHLTHPDSLLDGDSDGPTKESEIDYDKGKKQFSVWQKTATH